MADEKHKLERSSRIRKLCWITSLVLLAGWAVPLVVRVNFWRQEVAAALSGALGRPVHIGDLHLRVVGGAGFDVSRVVVEEDPAFGAEPFARIESVRANVALSSLWHGRIEFSSLHLVSPSFNVVRDAKGEWNLAKLGGDAAHSGAANLPSRREDPATAVPPRVRVEAGRINFKSGDRKKAYRIESVDLELTPPASPQQPWRFQFKGLPTRTDLPFRSTSPLQASGEVGPMIAGLPEEAGVPLHLDWSAENDMLAEVLTILTGRDPGVHGVLNLRGHLSGSTSLFRVSAEGEVHDLHRWDLHPTRGDTSLRAKLAGIVDLSTDTVELTSLTIPLGAGSVIVRGRIEDLFNHPQARMEAEFQQTSLAALAAIAPQFTTRIQRGFQADGTVQGRIHIERFPGASSGTMSGALSGVLTVSSGFVRPSESSGLVRFASFPVALDGPKGSLGPARATPEQGGPAQVSVQWDAAKHALSWKFAGDRVSMPSVARLAAELGWGSNFVQVSQGSLALRMDVHTSPDERPQIGGWARVSGAVLETRSVSQPLQISNARIQFRRGRVQVQPLSAALGPAAIEGTIAVRIPTGASNAVSAAAPVPAVEFTLSSPEVGIAELAAAFTPAEQAQSFFGFGGEKTRAASPLDVKLAAMWNSLQARGTFQADSLRYPGIDLEGFESSVYIHDRQVEITDFSAAHAGGTERGSAALYFAPGPFAFTLESRYAGLDVSRLTQSSKRWQGALSGEVSGTLYLSGSGRTADEILSQLNGSGEFHGVQVALRSERWAEALGMGAVPETHFTSLTSGFQISKRAIHISELRLISARPPLLSASPLDDAEGAARPAAWLISGAVGFDQSLELQVQPDHEGSEWHWAGTLAEPVSTRSTVTPNIVARDMATSRGGTANATTASRAGVPPLPPQQRAVSSGASISPKQASIPLTDAH